MLKVQLGLLFVYKNRCVMQKDAGCVAVRGGAGRLSKCEQRVKADDLAWRLHGTNPPCTPARVHLVKANYK